MILKRDGVDAYTLFWEHPNLSNLSHRRLSLPEWFSHSLSLRLSLESCIRVSSLCILYLSYTLLGPHSMGMAISILHFLYLTGPYPWNNGSVCFTFQLCVIALCMMYVCVYICLYVGDRALCMMDMWATLSSHKCSWPCNVGMCPRQLL